MQFKGCREQLFYTLIISSDNKDELKEIKIIKESFFKNNKRILYSKKNV